MESFPLRRLEVSLLRDDDDSGGSHTRRAFYSGRPESTHANAAVGI
jgi:hypothetical protein